MKKFSLLLLSLLFVFVAKAQLFNIGGFGVGYLYVGPKVGGNLSYNTIEASTGDSKITDFGYQLGGVAKFGITKKLSIQPELVFTNKGYAYENSFSTTHANYKYFGLPVVAKYAFLAVSGIQIYGSGGFYTDVMTGGKYVTEWVDGGGGEDYKIDNWDAYNRVDFGFNVGTGVNIPFKTKDQLNVDLRFNIGTTNVSSSNANSSSKNMGLQLSFVYLLDLTKWVNFKGKSILEEDAYEKNSAPAGGGKVEREE